ncbi:bifunctional diguanylate cyclase/phosphodiesterase [Thiomicrorhabdus sp. Kp2]|uniref:putative bifunctional diguanylate cyclase/phosphodiesterase n=1 Tax=Thiomicrorhabdus sp. Kp2 TaxID=1123518 RepID=UPI000409D6B3|nr:bifunctional diguanylate cyclase/phosphodiesterase [Thiomicrorhabdus sp. Kp2]
MRKLQISSLLIFLLPAFLGLGIMGVVYLYGTTHFIEAEQRNLVGIEQNAQLMSSTVNFIQKTGRLHSRLENLIEAAKKRTQSQEQLYIQHTQIIDELAILEKQFADLKSFLSKDINSQESIAKWQAGFVKFKNFTTMATDIIAIDPSTAENYINAAQKSFFDFSYNAYQVSEQLTLQTNQTLSSSKTLLEDSTQLLYIMFVASSLIAFLIAILAARKLSEYHRVILSSLSVLTQNSKRVPELPQITKLVETTTSGEIKNLGQAVLKFREVLITNQEEQTRIYELAYSDTLTKLPNRASLLKVINTELEELKRSQRQNLLLKINLNRFKLFNDGMGYEFGDELLKLVALRLKNFKQPNMECFRVGGDEFAIRVPCTSFQNGDLSQKLNMIAESLHEHLGEYFSISNNRIKITVNIGMTLYPLSDDDSPLEVFRHSMIALHNSKEHGQRQTVIFNEELLKNANDSFEVEKDLEKAIKNNELEFYLQSQVYPKSSIHYAESLVRWIHPQKGFISPAVFIGIAEKSELIIQIDKWMLNKACEFIVQQTLQGKKVHISVNISGRHFIKPGFIDYIDALILKTGVDANKLTIEITESVLMTDLEAVIEKMHYLRRYGIRFSIDDFGTGYSSLAYLKKLPVQELKIDKLFINDIASNEDDLKLVRAIFEVAKTFDLDVVVEGVEEDNQLEIVNKIGDPIIQGFIYAKPIPAGEWAKQIH